MPFDNKLAPSGLSEIPVMVSLWPEYVRKTFPGAVSPFRRSHCWTQLSSPAVKSALLPSRPNVHVKRGHSCSSVATERDERKSHKHTTPLSSQLASTLFRAYEVPLAPLHSLA